ncbi:MAG: hypothetical protein ACXABY_04875 [Candidatus Thorarchaeota archaeon]|jgi:hypothetical protein
MNKNSTGIYPLDIGKKWTRVCPIPRQAVEAWLKECDVDIKRIDNKGYCIVRGDMDQVTALYFHDYGWWVITNWVSDLTEDEKQWVYNKYWKDLCE